ncbi:hypothetical protein EOM39_00700 [Candidatus Gracilibacteria bacterium]|nr:hypothetical protein [Candidatus Gracilibacteria bacterium]
MQQSFNNISSVIEAIGSYNNLGINEISNIIKILLNKPIDDKGNIVYTIGSAGRGEQYGKIDDYDLVILGQNSEQLATQLTEIITTIKRECSLLIEFKSDNDIVFYEDSNTNSKTFFPSRFLDYKLIYGNIRYMKKLEIQYLQTIESIERKYLKEWAGRIGYHKKLSVEGKGKWKKNEYHIIDSNLRQLSYYREPNFEISLKIGPLRYLQYVVVRIIMNHIRNKEITNIDQSKIFGGNINDKLDYLLDLGKINVSFIEEEELKFLYNFLLKIHNFMSYNHKKNGDGI